MDFKGNHHSINGLGQALVIAFSLILCCCHSGKNGLSATPVYYTDDAFVHLLDVSGSGISIDAPQHIDGRYGDKDFSMDAWMRLNDSLLNVVLFSSFGNTLAEVTCSRDSVRFNSSMMDMGKIKAEYIIADIQLCYYDMAVLKPHFESYGFTLIETTEGDATLRKLSKGNKDILTIRKVGNTIELKNSLRNYSYTVTGGQAQ